MKLAIFFLTAALGLNAQAQEYKLLHRTYLDLTQIDLEPCRKSFRFVSGNHLACRVYLPQGEPGTKLAKITPGQFMPVKTTLVSEVPGHMAHVDIRDSAHDYIDASLATYLIFSMYYQLPDKPGYMQSLPEENYTWQVFETYLRQALAVISRDKVWKTSSPMIALPWGSSIVQEHHIGSVYVAKSTIPVRLKDCQASLRQIFEVDWWPEDGVWVTECRLSHSVLGNGSPLPLAAEYWSESLQAAAPKEITHKGMTFESSAWGWNVRIPGKREWNEIEADVRELFAKVGPTVEGYYIIDEYQLVLYGGPTWTEGKLIQKNGKLDIGPR